MYVTAADRGAIYQAAIGARMVQRRTRQGTAAMKILLAAAIALSAAVAPSVNAQTAPTATVFYGDLNLDTVAGQATLKGRINSAARSVCGRGDSDLAARTTRANCLRTAVTGAMKQLPAAPQFASAQ